MANVRLISRDATDRDNCLATALRAAPASCATAGPLAPMACADLSVRRRPPRTHTDCSARQSQASDQPGARSQQRSSCPNAFWPEGLVTTLKVAHSELPPRNAEERLIRSPPLAPDLPSTPQSSSRAGNRAKTWLQRRKGEDGDKMRRPLPLGAVVVAPSGPWFLDFWTLQAIDFNGYSSWIIAEALTRIVHQP
jgi:hypothetical protein